MGSLHSVSSRPMGRTEAVVTALCHISKPQGAVRLDTTYEAVWQAFVRTQRGSDLDLAVKALGGISGAAEALSAHWLNCPVRFH